MLCLVLRIISDLFETMNILPVFSRTILFLVVTITSGLISYPIDTIRRRMMMTSGQAVKYKGSIDCTVQILKNEGAMSLMKGAGANILRGVAGAGVLAGFDKIKEVYITMRKKQLGYA